VFASSPQNHNVVVFPTPLKTLATHTRINIAVSGYLEASGLGAAVRTALTAVLREAQEDALQLACGAGFEATDGYRPRGWARYDPLAALAKHLLAAAGDDKGGGGEGDGGVAAGSSAAAAAADEEEVEPGQEDSGGGGRGTVSAAEDVKTSDSGPPPLPPLPLPAAAEGAS
jgi:hypothetical protein